MDPVVGGIAVAFIAGVPVVAVGLINSRTQRETQRQNLEQHGNVHEVLAELVVQTRRNGTMLHAIMKTYDTPMIETDSVGSLLDMNLAARELLGLSLREATGEGWAKAVHPDDIAGVRDTWFESVKRATPWGPHAYRYVHADGTVVSVVGEALPITDTSNKVTAWVASVRPVQTKQLEHS